MKSTLDWTQASHSPSKKNFPEGWQQEKRKKKKIDAYKVKLWELGKGSGRIRGAKVGCPKEHH